MKLSFEVQSHSSLGSEVSLLHSGPLHIHSGFLEFDVDYPVVLVSVVDFHVHDARRFLVTESAVDWEAHWETCFGSIVTSPTPASFINEAIIG